VPRSPKDVYVRFIEFEEKAAGIYLKLASRSSHDRRLGGLWLDMAMEEKQHAGLLQFCVSERMFSAKLPSDAEISKFAALFRKLEKRASSPSVRANEAFDIAAELEGSEVNAIYSYLTMPLHASTYLFKRKVVASPSKHIDHVVTAAKMFDVPAATLKKLEGLKRVSPDKWFQAQRNGN
jgi:rubrerythrin